jgi:hypothetical protein
MVSSLVHVLIVTPVIFFWLRERHLGLEREPLPDTPDRRTSRRALVLAGVVWLAGVGLFSAWRLAGGGGGPFSSAPSNGGIVQTVRAGDVEIVLRAADGALRQGRNQFTIEFRRPDTTTLLDVGTVHASASMSMPGMVMSGGLQVTPSDVPGRYAATADFGMSGAWQISIDWNGPAGRGSINFSGSVQ